MIKNILHVKLWQLIFHFHNNELNAIVNGSDNAPYVKMEINIQAIELRRLHVKLYTNCSFASNLRALPGGCWKVPKRIMG